MRDGFATLLGILTAAVCQTAWAGPAEEIHARFEQWIATFNAHDPDGLSLLYDQGARLCGGE